MFHYHLHLSKLCKCKVKFVILSVNENVFPFCSNPISNYNVTPINQPKININDPIANNSVMPLYSNQIKQFYRNQYDNISGNFKHQKHYYHHRQQTVQKSYYGVESMIVNGSKHPVTNSHLTLNDLLTTPNSEAFGALLPQSSHQTLQTPNGIFHNSATRWVLEKIPDRHDRPVRSLSLPTYKVNKY